MIQNPADGLCADRAHGTVGAARRRRNRRLRAFLKHERMTVAMNLASIQHHSYMKSAVVDVGVQVGSPVAPVIEHMSSAPVIGSLAPATAVSFPSSGLVDPQFSLTVDETSHVAPAVSLSVPSQQLPFVYTTTTVITDDLEEFSAPVNDQVHQEQIAASEMPENIADIPVVHEQVIVGLRPERLVDARGPQRGLESAACPRSEAPLLSPVVMVQEAAHDDITAAFLLTQSLRQRPEEVEDAAMGREEDVEEDDGLLEYFCEDCVFL